MPPDGTLETNNWLLQRRRQLKVTNAIAKKIRDFGRLMRHGFWRVRRALFCASIHLDSISMSISWGEISTRPSRDYQSCPKCGDE
jgi:hypothetical protein